MSKYLSKLVLLLMLGGFLLTACQSGSAQGGTQTTPTAIPLAVADTKVVVDGRLVPRESVDLSFVNSGQVAEVLVKEGDLVKAGQVMARLSNREQLESNIANAKMELLSSQHDLLNAQQTLDGLTKDLPENQTQAFQDLKDARERLHDAERNLNGLNSPATQPDLDEARANVVLAKDVLDRAKKDFKPYENKAEDNVIRAALVNKVATAQRNYDAEVRRLNNLIGTSNEFTLTQAEAELQIAQQRVEQAQKNSDLLQKGPDSDELALAQDQVALAEGRVAASQAAITAAESELANLDMVATIDGTVTKLDLIAGEQVTPGATVVSLADFSQWYVDTDNLTEIEVVSISAGQKATISFDALPDLSLSGVVDTISDIYEDKRGDVTYTVRLVLNEPDPRLRWGMTTAVTFEQ